TGAWHICDGDSEGKKKRAPDFRGGEGGPGLCPRKTARKGIALQLHGNVPRRPFFISGVRCSGSTRRRFWFSFCFSGCPRASPPLRIPRAVLLVRTSRSWGIENSFPRRLSSARAGFRTAGCVPASPPHR